MIKCDKCKLLMMFTGNFNDYDNWVCDHGHVKKIHYRVS